MNVIIAIWAKTGLMRGAIADCSKLDAIRCFSAREAKGEQNERNTAMWRMC